MANIGKFTLKNVKVIDERTIGMLCLDGVEKVEYQIIDTSSCMDAIMMSDIPLGDIMFVNELEGCFEKIIKPDMKSIAVMILPRHVMVSVLILYMSVIYEKEKNYKKICNKYGITKYLEIQYRNGSMCIIPGADERALQDAGYILENDSSIDSVTYFDESCFHLDYRKNKIK